VKIALPQTTRGVALAAGIVSALIVSAAALVLADHFATRRAVDAELARADVTAGLLVASFRRELDKFRLASLVLTQDPDSIGAIASRDPAQLQLLSEKFESLGSAMNAATVYLIDADGVTLAASNWRLPTSFVGTNYSYRDYYRQALSQGAHEQFALGSRSRRPGLYIARRIATNDRPLGVIVVKVEFDALEAEWQQSGRQAFATNEQGVVLVTSVPEWRFQSTIDLAPAVLGAIQRSGDFGTQPLARHALFAAGDVASPGSRAMYRLPYVEAVHKLPTGWSVHVLAPTTEPVRAAVREARAGVLGALALIAALAAIAVFRRKSREAKAELRTSERLRSMNERLVQANKLATLGQIAAGVGHEINQPLAAIATYADNGNRLIAAGRTNEAADNLERIASLTTRIGKITSELRGFARKASGDIGAVSIDGAISGALLLLQDRLLTLGAVVHYPQAGIPVQVQAEHVRLEQVLVNLLQNALDAAGSGARIEIAIRRIGTMVEVAIRDDGPGLTDEARANLFQPFSTSKSQGLGLGLVISREIMADFGGELTANKPQRGAEFVLRLRAVE
jgi:two-component system, NtrC family, C4-dicarboxylate transport sensor histidine kinase DctB